MFVSSLVGFWWVLRWSCVEHLSIRLETVCLATPQPGVLEQAARHSLQCQGLLRLWTLGAARASIALAVFSLPTCCLAHTAVHQFRHNQTLVQTLLGLSALSCTSLGLSVAGCYLLCASQESLATFARSPTHAQHLTSRHATALPLRTT